MAKPAKAKSRRRAGRAPRTQPPPATAPAGLTFTEQMQQLDADPSHFDSVRGDSPRAKWMLCQQAIRAYERVYNETNNPTFVFEALYWALKTGEPDLAVAWRAAPAWVMEYFSRIAPRTHAMFTSRTPPKNPQNAVYRALEFTSTRKSNPVRVLVDDFHDQNIAFEVLTQVERGGKPDHVFEAVALEHPTKCYLNPKCKSLHRSTAARMWKRYGPVLQARCAFLRQVSAQMDAVRAARGLPSPRTTTLKAISEKYLGKEAAQNITVDVSFL